MSGAVEPFGVSGGGDALLGTPNIIFKPLSSAMGSMVAGDADLSSRAVGGEKRPNTGPYGSGSWLVSSTDGGNNKFILSRRFKRSFTRTVTCPCWFHTL